MRLFVLASCLLATLSAQNTQQLTLNSAIEMALNHSHSKKLTQLNYQVAQAQYEQALSANYPKLDLNMYAIHKDEEKNLGINSELSKDLAFAQALRKTGSIAIAQNVASSTTSDSQLHLEGKDALKTDLNLTYPLYTGGKITAIIQQALLNKKIAQEQMLLEDEEIIFNVKKIYYGVALSQMLHKATLDSIDRMQAVADMTKGLYESDDMSVKKTDYLDVKVNLSLLQARLQSMKKNMRIAQAALANIIGLPYTKAFFEVSSFSTVLKNSENLQKLIEDALTNSRLINKVQFAIEISKAKIDESKSAFLPSVAFFANTSRYYNSTNGGYNTPENQKTWAIGVNATMNLFDGFKNKNTLMEKRLSKKKLETQKKQIKEWITLQVQDIFFSNEEHQEQIQLYKRAWSEAIEHRSLNIKAYQIGMEETEKVIKSQLKEYQSELLYQKSLHDYFLSYAKLTQLVGEK